MRFQTKSLDLIAATVEHVQAELESPECLASLLDAEIGEGWPPGEYDRGAQEFFRDSLASGGKEAIGWYHWYAIHKNSPDHSPILVGVGGYTGLPDEDGKVEIGFSVMPDQRGLGYASEMVKAFTEIAFADERVCKVIAHTSPQNIASCKVLEKAGLQKIGFDEENDLICFEICRSTTF